MRILSRELTFFVSRRLRIRNYLILINIFFCAQAKAMFRYRKIRCGRFTYKTATACDCGFESVLFSRCFNALGDIPATDACFEYMFCAKSVALARSPEILIKRQIRYASVGMNPIRTYKLNPDETPIISIRLVGPRYAAGVN